MKNDRRLFICDLWHHLIVCQTTTVKYAEEECRSLGNPKLEVELFLYDQQKEACQGSQRKRNFSWTSWGHCKEKYDSLSVFLYTKFPSYCYRLDNISQNIFKKSRLDDRKLLFNSHMFIWSISTFRLVHCSAWPVQSLLMLNLQPTN